MKIGLVILAAGLGSRFGSDKMLANLNATTVLQATLESYPTNCDFVERVAVVRPGKAEEIAANQAFAPILNHHPGEGLSSSLRLGVTALRSRCDWLMIGLGDMPFIRPDTIIRLLLEISLAQNLGCIFPTLTNEAKQGHPVCWHQSQFDRLCAIEGDKGGGNLIKKVRSRPIEIDDKGIYHDIDTRKDISFHSL